MPSKVAFTKEEFWQIGLLCRIGLETVSVIDDETVMGIWSKIEPTLSKAAIEEIDDLVQNYRESLEEDEGDEYGEWEVDPKIMDQIEEALDNGNRLRIRYFAHTSGETTERVIRPYEIIYEGNGPFLSAYCELRRADRQFRLDAIEKILEVLPPAKS